MKVKNFGKMRDGERNDIHAFDCVLKGVIEMTAKEWKEARTYLLRSGGDKIEKARLRSDLERVDERLEAYAKGRYTWRNIRVKYTLKLFMAFALPNYKEQNYVIKITK